MQVTAAARREWHDDTHGARRIILREGGRGHERHRDRRQESAREKTLCHCPVSNDDYEMDDSAISLDAPLALRERGAG